MCEVVTAEDGHQYQAPPRAARPLSAPPGSLSPSHAPHPRRLPFWVISMGCSPDSGSKWGTLAEGGDGEEGRSGDFVPGSLPAGLPCTHLLPPRTRVTAPARWPCLYSRSVPRCRRGESPLSLASHSPYSSLPLFVDSFFPQFSQFKMLSSSCQNTCPVPSGPGLSGHLSLSGSFGHSREYCNISGPWPDCTVMGNQRNVLPEGVVPQ